MRKNRQRGGESSAWRSGGKVEKTLGFLLKNQQGKDSPHLYTASRSKKIVGMGDAVHRDACDASPVPGWN